MSTLNYVKQTATTVSVTYSDMPAGIDLAFVNDTSKDKTPAQGGLPGSGGSGTADITIPSLKGGGYYLLAEKSGAPVAQTVKFYIS